MKRIILLFTIALFPSDRFAQVWETQNSSVKVTLRDVYFLDTLNGWVTTDTTIFLHTTDGGSNWLIEKINNENYSVQQIQFVSKNIGYACGSYGRLFSTKDGGKTWLTYSNLFEINFIDLSFVNENEGWAVGEYYGLNFGRGMIVHTSDGGTSWEKQLEVESANQFAVRFFKSIRMKNNMEGWAIAGNYLDNFSPTHVYKTADGGENWEELSTPIQRPAQRIKIAREDTLWADGYGVAPMSTTKDGGFSWETSQGSYKYITAISPQSGNKGWICNSDFYHNLPSVILYTTNCGISWDSELSVNDYILDIENKGNYLWIVGTNGLIMKRTALPSSIEENTIIPSLFHLYPNYPNPFNSQTTISYNLQNEGDIEIEIYDALGRIIRTFNFSNQHIGKNELFWDARDDFGNVVSSGIYIYKLKTTLHNGKSSKQLSKMILLK